ncbi:S-layer homology domain-containing protein [Paenibacillus harenae]|uniref:SLH domain-containing protein n=2 Tax=Paenibacillus harenae TaxID=306543 RepID=A0ABT9U5E7_PAEHA|nr:S-layer homology domain-containing protein [Paenibacillus harenae]MDQ0113639.1 hypothetical protein [Paenibacillus harenae]
MKKSLSLLVAIAMVFSMFASVAFAAEEPTTTAKYDELVKAGVFTGFTDGEAHLDETMTRAQAAVIIAKLAGYKAGVTSPDAGFTDVPAGHWAKAYVDFAANLGIIAGLGNGTFAPKAEVTIQELAKLAVDALTKLGYTLKEGVAVEGKVADWAKGYVATAVTNGIIPAQADYTVPALRELLVTATYTAYVALQVPSAITVESVKATNSKTVVATFNVEVGTAVANNFSVHVKDDVYNINVVDSVAVDGKTVTVKTIDGFDPEKTYVLVADGVTSAKNNLVLASTSTEFKYAETAAASIAFGQTTVADDTYVPVVIKNAAGNDITADFDLTSDILVETSNPGVVDEDLYTDNNDATKSEYSVVNVILLNEDGEATSIETGNQIITVNKTLATATTIKSVSFDGTFAKEDLSLEKSDTRILFVDVEDKDGNNVAADVTIRSQNPTVAVVDDSINTVFGVKAGTATILVQATFNGKTVSKTVTVTVKEDAKLTSLALELPNSKLVKDSGINQTLTVKFLDQYNEEFELAANSVVNFTINKDDVVAGLSKPLVSGNVSDSEVVVAGDKKLEYTLVPGATKGTANLTVELNGVKKSVALSLVEAGAFAGYAAVVSDTTLDLTPGTSLSSHPGSVAVSVYVKDVNGNYIDTVPTSDVQLVEASTAGDSAVDTNVDVVSAQAVGTENVVVQVNNAKVTTIKFTVVDTAVGLNKVVQAKNAVTVAEGADVFTALFGTDANGAAFVGYDQYGDKILVAEAQVQAFTSNASIVDVTTWTAGADAAGKTATLTINVAGTLFVVTVKVV